MAWVSYDRVLRGTGVQGKYGEPWTATRRWTIRVDSPLTTEADIIAGVTATMGITFGSAHPAFAALKAMEFDCSPETEDGIRWALTIRYYVPTPEKKVQANGRPADFWERAGGTTSVPVFRDSAGTMITNSAFEPVEGLEREREESAWTLTKFYTTDAALEADITGYAGRVNSATWAGGAAKTWKAYFKGAKKTEISKLDGVADGGTLSFIEARWEFRYDPETWKAMPWDVGFMELVSGSQRRVILGNDGKPVKQPVALNTNGTRRTPGQAPSIIRDGAGADLYLTANFSTAFGSPALL